jgi:hypothetical protein
MARLALRRYAASAFVLLALLPACQKDAERKTGESADAAARAVELAVVDGGRLSAPRAAVRVLVTPTAIAVDDVALVASFSEAVRARVRSELASEDTDSFPFRHARLLRLDRFGFDDSIDRKAAVPDLPALRQVLEYSGSVERSARRAAGAGLNGAWFDANLYVAATTPYRVLRAVLSATYRSEHVAALVVRGRSGEVVLRSATQRIIESNAAPRRNGSSGLFRLHVSTEGVTITLEGAEYQPPTLRGRPVTFADRACPAVKRHKARIDGQRLTLLLTTLARAIELPAGKEVVRLSAEPDTPWRDVAEALDASAAAGFELAHYADLGPADEGRAGSARASDCSGDPVPVEQLSADSVIWGR